MKSKSIELKFSSMEVVYGCPPENVKKSIVELIFQSPFTNGKGPASGSYFLYNHNPTNWRENWRGIRGFTIYIRGYSMTMAVWL